MCVLATASSSRTQSSLSLALKFISHPDHGYDGRRDVDSERGEQYGPRFGTGDIIGCGLLLDRREIFFTKNGTHLGIAFRRAAWSTGRASACTAAGRRCPST